MTLTLILTAGGLLLAFFVLFVFLFRGSTVESALVEKVTRPVQVSRPVGADLTLPVVDEKGVIDIDSVAKPFSWIRGIFSGSPDTTLAKRLALAGYRKPAHADIFLGSRLVFPPLLAFSVAYVAGDNGVFYFLLT